MSGRTCRAAICDDSALDCALLKEQLIGWAAQRQVCLTAEIFPSAESFLFRYAEDKRWDILLLDIEMGPMDGVAMAKEIRRQNATVQILFVTGYSDYIAEGYEVAALHYLLKPVDREKLWTVLDRAMEKLTQGERALRFTTEGEMVHIPFHTIRYAEVHLNYVTIHADEQYTLKRTLGELERELDDRFFRAGRSLLLNLAYARRVAKGQVTLSDGTKLPLPRGVYEPLNRAIIQHS